MRKTIIILCLFAFIVGSCKNKPTINNSETNLSVLIEDTITPPSTADSIHIRINQIIGEELAVRNLKEYTIIENNDSIMENYRYAFNNDNYTGFWLTIQTFDSEQLAKQEVRKKQKIHEESVNNEEFVKIAEKYLRINNKLYSLSNTANIEHIEHKIIVRIIEEMQIKEEDTGIW